MFGDDSFGGIEDLFNQVSEARRYFSNDTKDQTKSLLNTIKRKEETILIFDLSGKKIISIKIKDYVKMNEYGEGIHDGQKVLTIELENNEILNYGIDKILGKIKLSHKFTNGILEVFLRR